MSFTAMSFEDYSRMESEGRDSIVIVRALPTAADVRALLSPEQHVADATIAWVIEHAAKRYHKAQHVNEWTELVSVEAAAVISGANTPQGERARRMRQQVSPGWFAV